MVCENFPNLVKVTFICNRTKSLEEFQKSVLQNFRAQRQKEGTLAQAALWTSGHKTRLICLKFSMSFHSWWGRKRLWALRFVWNIKKKKIFFFFSLAHRALLQLGCLSFPHNLLKKVCWSHSGGRCPWYFQVWGAPYSTQSLLSFFVPVKYQSFSKWIPWVSGGWSYDVVRFSVLFFYVLGSDSALLFSILRVSGHKTESCCIKKETAFSGH